LIFKNFLLKFLVKKEEWMKKTLLVVLVLASIIFAISYQKDDYSLSLNILFQPTYSVIFNEKDENYFSLGKNYLDIKCQYKNILLGRAYLDLSAKDNTSYDLYLSLKKNKMEFRFGKFKQLLGYEIAQASQDAHFVSPSLINPLRAPKGARDLGIGFFYNEEKYELNLNLVNGEGRETNKDVNKWKDISFRFLIKPIAKGFIGFNTYFGKVDENEKTTLRIGGELGYEKEPYTFITEALYKKDKDEEDTLCFYGILGYQMGNTQPLLRAELLEKKLGITFGLTFHLIKNVLKILPNVSLYKKDKDYTIKILTQLRGYL
jgi:hypothetical protein